MIIFIYTFPFHFIVKLDLAPTLYDVLPSISGAKLPGVFEAVEVHFHWGNGTVKGGEHMIDNRRYDGEMHIVHKNVKYNTVSEASKHKDGLAVLGIMMDITYVSIVQYLH